MKGIFILIFLLLLPVLARAQLPNEDNVSPPDLNGWMVTERSTFGVEPVDGVSVYLGFVIKYQNPKNEQEFIRVWVRFNPLASRRITIQDNRSGQVFLDSRAQAKTEEELQKRRERNDPFIYERYLLVRDSRTGYQLQSGPTETWLLDDGGNWTYSSRGEKEIVPHSHILPWDAEVRLVVGQEFRLNGKHHILQMHPDELLEGGG